MGNCCRKTVDLVFHYETIKLIDIRNKKVGALFRLLQFIILSYALFAIVYKKGYQAKDTAISTVSTKLKGIAFANFKNFSTLFDGIQVFDPADYVIPPQETNSFFVMTNMIITPNQTQGKCPEDVKFEENWCLNDSDCQPEYSIVKNGNGIRTGACVRSDRNPLVKVCEIYAWCPTERSDLRNSPDDNSSIIMPILHAARNFTVLVKNQIRFPKFNVIRRNIISENQTHYLNNCTYNAETDQQCPIFKLDEIIKYCGDDFDDVAIKGAIYGIIINWHCDLDYSVENCIPSYDFRRLDDPHAPLSPGYNFRFSQYYVKDDTRYRFLTKAYGLKFQVLVNARAGKFAPEPLFLELGSAVALFALSTWICDVIVIYCVKKRNRYKRSKYEVVEDEDTDED